MSWDSYIANLKGHSQGACDKVCIIGLADGSIWTTVCGGEGIAVTPEEASKIASSCRTEDYSSFQANGIYLEGEKYQFLRAVDGKIVLGKKKDKGAITMQCSKTAIVIGHTAEGETQGNTNKAVATIAEYLETVGM